MPIASCSDGDRLLQIVDDTRLSFVTFDFAAVDDVGDLDEGTIQHDVPDVVVEALGGWETIVGPTAEGPTNRPTWLRSGQP